MLFTNLSEESINICFSKNRWLKLIQLDQVKVILKLKFFVVSMSYNKLEDGTCQNNEKPMVFISPVSHLV